MVCPSSLCNIVLDGNVQALGKLVRKTSTIFSFDNRFESIKNH